MKTIKNEPEEIGRDLTIETETRTKKEGDESCNQVDAGFSEKLNLKKFPIAMWFPGAAEILSREWACGSTESRKWRMAEKGQATVSSFCRSILKGRRGYQPGKTPQERFQNVGLRGGNSGMETPQTRELQEKTIIIKIFGEKDKMPFVVQLSPEKTVGQVLSELGLDGYLMFMISSRIVVSSREPLFFRVSNGEILGAVRDENPFMEDD